MAKDKIFPKLILEGARLTCKTDLAFLLNDHPRLAGSRKYKYWGGIVSAEWSGLSRDAWGESLITYSPHNSATALAGFRAWVDLFETLRFYRWTIDRFHISTIVYQLRKSGNRVDFQWLEDRLLPLGFRIIFLTRNKQTFETAKKSRLKISSNPSQYDDLSSIILSQDIYEDVIGTSKLLHRKFDVSDDDIERVADEIVMWLEATDGLQPL